MRLEGMHHMVVQRRNEQLVPQVKEMLRERYVSKLLPNEAYSQELTC